MGDRHLRGSNTGAVTLAATLGDTNTPYELFILREGQDDVKLSDHGKILKDRTFDSCSALACPSADGEVKLDGLYLTPTDKKGDDGTPKEPLPLLSSSTEDQHPRLQQLRLVVLVLGSLPPSQGLRRSPPSVPRI